MKRIFPTVFLAFVISGSAMADYSLYSEQFSACMDKSEGVTFAMVDCINEELTIQDARLNSAYKKLGAKLTPERKIQLRDVQRIWIRYRDANCAFHADPEGGSLARIAGNHCFLQETTLRAQELEQL